MTISDFAIRDVPTKVMSDISSIITSIDVSWTMDAVSQMTVKIFDKDGQFFLKNYFQIRRIVTYRNEIFEIASVEIDQGEGFGANITLECRRIQIQLMKRDKSPASYSGVTAKDYAQIVASKFGLKFVGERTSTARSISKTSGSGNDESVWDVLKRLAGEAQFQVFESDNTLYFASQEWLLGKWANLTFKYPTDLSSPFQLMSIPNCRKSDDDPNEAEVRFVLRRSDTTMNLRPGMTVNLVGMGEFSRQYLISEVAYSLGQPDPIGVSCRTPVKKKPK